MEKEIRARHEALEAMVFTQSVHIQTELRSQAHKDRGELLTLITELRLKNARLLMELASAKERVDALKSHTEDGLVI